MAVVGFVATDLFLFQFRNVHKVMEVERFQREGYYHEQNIIDDKYTPRLVIDEKNLEVVTHIKSVTK